MSRDGTPQRREHRPLGGTHCRLHLRLAVAAPHVHALANASQPRPIDDPQLQPPLQRGAIHPVEAGHEVGLTSPRSLAPVYELGQGASRVMGPAARPEALGALQAVLLGDDLPHLAYGVLDPRVLERRHPTRPRLPLSLGAMDTSERLLAVLLRFQPCVEPLEMRCPRPPVWLLRAPSHAYRRGGTLPARGACEGRHSDPRRQRVEPACGFAVRSFHSLHTSR